MTYTPLNFGQCDPNKIKQLSFQIVENKHYNKLQLVIGSQNCMVILKTEKISCFSGRNLAVCKMEVKTSEILHFMQIFSQVGSTMATIGKFSAQFEKSMQPVFPHNYLNIFQIMKKGQMCTLFALAILIKITVISKSCHTIEPYSDGESDETEYRVCVHTLCRHRRCFP